MSSDTSSAAEGDLMRHYIDIHERVAAWCTESIKQASATTALQKCDSLRKVFVKLGNAQFVPGSGGLEEQWMQAMEAKLRLCESQLDLVAMCLGHVNEQMKRKPEALRESFRYESLTDRRKEMQTLEIQSRRELICLHEMASPIDAGTALYAERAASHTVAQAWIHGLTRHLEYLDSVNHPRARSRNHARANFACEYGERPDPLPPGREARARASFRRNLKAVYGYKIAEKVGKGRFWCVVTHRFSDSGYLRSMHIVPPYLGEKGVAMVFGQPAREVWYGVGNGLLVQVDVAEAFEAFRWTIIPSVRSKKKEQEKEKDEGGQEEEYKVFILDPSLMTSRIKSSATKFADFHGRALDFKHATHRPTRRYLYFMFVVAMAVSERRRPGSAASVLCASSKLMKPWKGCDRLLDRGILRKLVKYIAHDGGALGLDEEVGVEMEAAGGSDEVGDEQRAVKPDGTGTLLESSQDERAGQDDGAQEQVLRDLAARFVIRVTQAEEVDSDEEFTSESDQSD